MNLLKITQTFQTENEALDYLIKARWPNGMRCLACGHEKVYRIATVGKTGKPCRLFECAACGLHFSATTGTLFHDSHLSLRQWFMAMALMVEAKKGISANQVARHIGVSYKTAWYLCHRIRKAMEEQTTPLGSTGQVVEIDEALIGGETRGKGWKAGKENKISILGLAERGGRVYLKTIPNAKRTTLQPIIKSKLSEYSGKVVTDGLATYNYIIPKEKHEETNHKQEIQFEGEVSTKTIEGAFSLFKRGVVGQYHKLGRDHMDAYLGEFCWRYNRRRQQAGMFQQLLKGTTAKKPMTYKELVNTF